MWHVSAIPRNRDHYISNFCWRRTVQKKRPCHIIAYWEFPPRTIRVYPIDRVIRLLHLPVYKMAALLYHQLNSQSNADSGNSQRALISIHVVTDSQIDWIGSNRAISSASPALSLCENLEVTTRGKLSHPTALVAYVKALCNLRLFHNVPTVEFR
jgi:hypothetical protein